MRREEDVSLFLLNERKMGENVGGKVKEAGRRDQKIEGKKKKEKHKWNVRVKVGGREGKKRNQRN